MNEKKNDSRSWAQGSKWKKKNKKEMTLGYKWDERLWVMNLGL